MSEGVNHSNPTRTAEKDGHNNPCFYCGEPCDVLAGDPGKWPLVFCQPDDTGIARTHHVRCVTERLSDRDRLAQRLADAERALQPFAATAASIDQACDEADEGERARALATGDEPITSGRPSDDTNVELRFLAWGGDEVGDVEYEEFRERELTLREFRCARQFLAGEQG